MEKIYIYCELNNDDNNLEDTAYELISKAHKLKLQAHVLKNNSEFEIVAIALGEKIDEFSIKKAYEAGADEVVLIKNENLKRFSQTIFAQSFIEYFCQKPANIILFPATATGRILAPRITTILETGLVADCTGLDFVLKEDELRLAPTRPTFGSELMATILSKKDPQCATIRPKTFKADFTKEPEGKYSEYQSITYGEDRIKLLNSEYKEEENTANFSDAKIVLIAGYGLLESKNKEYFEKIKRLAEALGAKIGTTRKVVDYKILPQNMQIGQTGATIDANLCISFGVSGAIQHVMGMKNCKTIIAVNNDENAEIFNYADYKIIANAQEVIDELLYILTMR